LLTFAKGGDPIKETLSLASVITDTAKFSLRGSKVKLQFDIDPTLWLVAADKGQLSQVISNLVINAQQAMGSDGGQLIVRTRNSAASGVIIVVEDNGPGIPEDIRGKIFEPFFTTKPAGQGTGLGLSVTYGIVKDHGGDIEIEDAPGGGTRFVVSLPVKAVKAA